MGRAAHDHASTQCAAYDDTHTDYVQHGNHVDAVPHTTTHIDSVPHTTTYFDQVTPYGNQPIVNQQYRSARPVIQGRVIQGQYPQQQYTQGQAYPQQTYQQQGRVIYRNGVRQTYTQPYQSYRPSYQPSGHLHTETHTDHVPHTQTHIDYQQHGNHLHAVPYTTTNVHGGHH